MGESLATGLVDSFCGAISFLYGSKPCPAHVSGKRARKILYPDLRENTGETGVARQKNQEKNKKSLTGVAQRCITRSRRCGTKRPVEPGRAGRPGTAGQKVF